MITSDPVLEVIRKELRRVSPDVRITPDQIRSVIVSEVIKREVMEGEKADEARKKIARVANKLLRAANNKASKGAADGAVDVMPADAVEQVTPVEELEVTAAQEGEEIQEQQNQVVLP